MGISEIAERYELHFILLFGSGATGTATDESDVPLQARFFLFQSGCVFHRQPLINFSEVQCFQGYFEFGDEIRTLDYEQKMGNMGT